MKMLQNMPRENKYRWPQQWPPRLTPGVREGVYTAPNGVEKWSEYEVQDLTLPPAVPPGGGGSGRCIRAIRETCSEMQMSKLNWIQ